MADETLIPFKIRRVVANGRDRWVPEDPALHDRAYCEDSTLSYSQIYDSLFNAIDQQYKEEEKVYARTSVASDLEQLCFEAINRRSDELIERGFEYNGMVFSLSSNARERYTVMLMQAAALAPLDINALDDRSVLTLGTAAEIETFCQQALGTVLYVVNTGTEQKHLIRTAREQDDVTFLESYVDPRA